MANDRKRTNARAAANSQNIQPVQQQEMKLDNVIELQQILLAVNKLREEHQISQLMEQMQEMQKNYESVVQELAAVKEQLKEQSPAEPLDSTQKGVLFKLAEEADAKVTNQNQKLQEAGKDLNEKSKSLVQKFKEAGISALNKVCEFLGIKEKLVTLRDEARSNAATMQASVDKIDKIESELGATKNHAKNVVKAIMGKETSDVPKEKKGGFLSRLKAHYMKLRDKYSSRADKLSKAIDKFDSLEKAAQGIKEEKKSLSEKLEDNKKVVEFRDTAKKEGTHLEKTDKPRSNAER